MVVWPQIGKHTTRRIFVLEVLASNGSATIYLDPGHQMAQEPDLSNKHRSSFRDSITVSKRVCVHQSVRSTYQFTTGLKPRL
jgi:hypothetical protein